MFRLLRFACPGLAWAETGKMNMASFQVVDVKITRIVEMEGPTRGDFLFADATPDGILSHAWLRPDFAFDDGKLNICIQALVIESCGRRIVVDTCVGNDKVRSNPMWNKLQGAFLSDMETAGFPVDSIDTVVCTHLHVDHVGWNTRWTGVGWVPTFTQARYLFGRTEWEHWSESTEAEDDDVAEERVVVEDSVRPVVDAGLVDLVESNHRLTDEVRLEPTPGHTPGHVSVRIRSRGEEAVITGDLIHHPIQCAEIDWASRFDVDPDQARQTRRAFLTRCAEEGTRVLGTHFATPTAGRVVVDGEVFRFEGEKSDTKS
jgi:glyoxylase-like metal-dependent hydrolase (beta-lactamase superfamily II)